VKKVFTLEELTDASYGLLSMINESDNACVINGAAFLDAVLAGIIDRRLRDSDAKRRLMSPDGALGTYGARVDLAYCLKLIEKSRYDDLKTIGRIRNRFAHSFYSLDFNEHEIRQLCDNLKEWRVTLELDSEKTPDNLTPKEIYERTKAEFIFTVQYLTMGILNDSGIRPAVWKVS
jgi:hypothetical protein